MVNAVAADVALLAHHLRHLMPHLYASALHLGPTGLSLSFCGRNLKQNCFLLLRRRLEETAAAHHITTGFTTDRALLRFSQYIWK